MTPAMQRGIVTILLILSAFIGIVPMTKAAESSEGATYAYYEEEEVKQRLEEMPCLVKPKYESTVKGYLLGYTVRNREKAEGILGRTTVYFPLFEQYLQEHNLPDALKYLAVVESALDPNAVSPVGATGLWQFMDYTGRDFGLKINRTVDERRDPVKSTQAAMAFLGLLYERFGNWELALAAYNSGGGRVSRAMKRARSRNFWRIRRYLPRETRNYVPAFIAATYLGQYYYHHQLAPQYPQIDLQLTERLLTTEYVSFFRIAQVTGLSLDLIETLNPAYVRGYIPESQEGNYLILPKRVMPAVKDYLRLRELEGNHELEVNTPVYRYAHESPNWKENYFESIYIVREEDRLENIAQLLHCTPYDLQAWNRLTSWEVRRGQELVHYYPREIRRFRPAYLSPLEPLPQRSVTPSTPELKLELREDKAEVYRRGKYLYYRPKRHETWIDIAAKFPEVTLEQLLLLNEIDASQPTAPGTKVRIRRF